LSISEDFQHKLLINVWGKFTVSSGFFNDAGSTEVINYTAKMTTDDEMGWSWLVSRYYPGISLNRFKKSLIQDN
jgi:hypothetical protein